MLEHLLALHAELRRQRAKPTATPEEARAANADLRLMMAERGNYFAEIERAAAEALAPVGYSGGALSQGMLLSVVDHHGFAVRYVQDLPRSARSVTDLRNRRIYLRQESLGMHTPRAVLLQTLGHFVLGHSAPADFGEFLRQRVEANYFAAAVLVPEQAAAKFLQEAKDARDLSVEDLRDVFSVSYEMAAHRFTNLATHHLDIPCHFVKNDESGIIYKAYENDGVVFPADPAGRDRGAADVPAVVGAAGVHAPDRFSPYFQYSDTPSGTYWCTAFIDSGRERGFAITLGAPYDAQPLVPRPGHHDPDDVALPGWGVLPAPAGRARRAVGGHGVAVGPRPLPHPARAAVGSFPGVDEADVFEFLDRHAAD